MSDIPVLIEFPSIGKSDIGYITVAQHPDVVPFEVKRVYWTYFTPHHVERGNHAHKCLKQLIIAVAGTIEFTLESRNGDLYQFLLDTPTKGLYIPEMYWRKIKFSHNAVLLCLASEVFEENDYIRSYEEFKG